MAHETFDSFGGVPYVVMVAKRALVGANALFERSGGIVCSLNCLGVRGVHTLACASFTS